MHTFVFFFFLQPPKGKKSKRKSRKDSTSSQEEEEEEAEEYEDSAPSSAEIQVIHKHPTPKNLHSILKQRTVSESSEDLSHGHVDLPDSPRSEGEEQLSSSGGLKKQRSVSFNSHVDHTSFKASASVSSMTPALKSKRKRQRKREERMKRGRNNSEGGTSSSEECNSGRAGLSYSEGEEEDGAVSGNKVGLSRSLSDPGAGESAPFTLSPIADKREEEVEGNSSPGVSKEKASESKKEHLNASSQPSTNRVLDFRTSSSKSKVTEMQGDSQKAAVKEVGGGDVANGQGSIDDGIMESRKGSEKAEIKSFC